MSVVSDAGGCDVFVMCGAERTCGGATQALLTLSRETSVISRRLNTLQVS